MQNSISTLIQNQEWLAAPLAVLLGLGILIKLLRSAFDFHYEYFARRKTKQLKDILSETKNRSQINHFIQQLIECEQFKLATKLKISQEKAEALMHLCQHKVISANQVNLYHQSISIDANNSVSIEIKLIDKIAAIYGIASAFAILIWGVYGLMTSLKIDHPFGWLAGAIVFLFSVLAAKPMINEYIRFKAIKKAKLKLERNPTPALGSHPTLSGSDEPAAAFEATQLEPA